LTFLARHLLFLPLGLVSEVGSIVPPVPLFASREMVADSLEPLAAERAWIFVVLEVRGRHGGHTFVFRWDFRDVGLSSRSLACPVGPQQFPKLFTAFEGAPFSPFVCILERAAVLATCGSAKF